MCPLLTDFGSRRLVSVLNELQPLQNYEDYIWIFYFHQTECTSSVLLLTGNKYFHSVFVMFKLGEQ